MDPMKLSPLATGQWSKNGMMEQSVLHAKAGLTLRNRRVHGGDARSNFAGDLLRCHPARQGVFRRLSALGHMSQSNHDDGSDAIPEHAGSHLRLSRLEATLEGFRGPCVGQIEVLENFGCAPLSFRMTPQIFGSHALRCGLDTFL